MPKKLKAFLSISLIFFTSHFYSQQYDTVYIENDSIDENNEVYKVGNVFIYDYEIILKNKKYKLKSNKGVSSQLDFDFAPIDSDSVSIDKIHMFVSSVADSLRINQGQSQISFVLEPDFNSISSTGVVENEKNIWIHPIRKGFFSSLETAPFPYIIKPYKIGNKWKDEMKIGQNWSNKLWGEWDGSLLLKYSYKLKRKVFMKTNFNSKLECYIIESKAKSRIGTTKLRAYFSPKYGFLRFEYVLLNDLKINIWLVDFKTGKEFNDMQTFFRTKEYIKN